jgi:hypothetical protein
MANSFVELLNQSMAKVVKSVDLTIQRRSVDGSTYADGLPDPALYKMFPLVSYSSVLLAILKLKVAKPMLGSVVAIDQEIPQERNLAEVTEETIGNLKIGKSHVYLEEDFVMLNKINMMAQSNNPGQVAAAAQLLMTYQAVPSQLVDACLFKLFVLTMRIACLGRCAYTDPKTDYAVELSYDAPVGHFATTLTGAARWSQAVTATGINNLVDHLAVYYATNQRFPDKIPMNSKNFNELRSQNATKEFFLRDSRQLTNDQTVNTAALAGHRPLTPDELNNVLKARLMDNVGAAPNDIVIMPTDGRYYERNKAGDILTQFYVPPDYYFFYSAGMMEQCLFPNAANDFAGGAAVNTEIIRKDPRNESVTTSIVGIPLVADPRMLGGRNVNDTAIAA